jgi:hypothetical protein
MSETSIVFTLLMAAQIAAVGWVWVDLVWLSRRKRARIFYRRG